MDSFCSQFFSYVPMKQGAVLGKILDRHATKENIYKYVTAKKKVLRVVNPDKMGKNIKVERLRKGNKACYHISEIGRAPGRKIFYIYDSSYCYPMRAREWKFVIDLMKDVGAEIFVPEYPLLPENSCKDVIQNIIETYKEFITGFNMEEVILMGSGVGASFALSLNLVAWQEGIAIPALTTLISPVLDSEFKDEAILEKMKERAVKLKKYELSEGVIGFLKDYWIKDSGERHEYTSPMNEKMNYISGDILVISGTEDIYNAHAREFCRHLYDVGKRPYYFEYTGAEHDFVFDKGRSETKHVRKIFKDLFTGSRETILNNYMYEVKRRGELTKKHPEIFTDEIATKYLAKNRIWYKKYKRSSDYRNLVEASKYHDFDEAVRLFLMEYPESTVVYLGCSLDTMFERVDNGRVMWYNLDSPGRIAVRNMYTSPNEREKIIDISVNDLSWFDEIKCEQDKGLLFVCGNILGYFREKEVRQFLAKLGERFQGCNVLFEVNNHIEMMSNKIYMNRIGQEYRARRFYLDDPESSIESWDPGYKVISAKPVLDGVVQSPGWNSKLKFIFHIGRRFQGTRIVRVRLGYEKFADLY